MGDDEQAAFILHGEERDHMLSGLFWALVREVYNRLGNELPSDTPEPTPIAIKYELLTQAIKETVVWFPPKLRERIDGDAERLAATWLGIEYVQPKG